MLLSVVLTAFGLSGPCLILGLIYSTVLTVDFVLIRLLGVGGGDNGQLELVLVSSNWLTLLLCYVY